MELLLLLPNITSDSSTTVLKEGGNAFIDSKSPLLLPAEMVSRFVLNHIVLIQFLYIKGLLNGGDCIKVYPRCQIAKIHLHFITL